MRQGRGDLWEWAGAQSRMKKTQGRKHRRKLPNRQYLLTRLTPEEFGTLKAEAEAVFGESGNLTRYITLILRRHLGRPDPYDAMLPTGVPPPRAADSNNHGAEA